MNEEGSWLHHSLSMLPLCAGQKDSFHSIKEIAFEAYTYKEDDRRQNSEDYWVSKKAVVHHPKENGSLRQHEVPMFLFREG